MFPFVAGDENRYGASRRQSRSTSALQLIFYAGALWFMANHWKTVVRGVKQAKWIVVLLLIAIASTAWSQDPLFTLRRSLVLAGNDGVWRLFRQPLHGASAIAFAGLDLRAWSCFPALRIAILLPRFGVDHFLHPGDWQGAFTQKNMLARIMVLALLVFYFAKHSVAPLVRWAGIAGAFALLVLSRSVTGAIVFTAIVRHLPLYRLLRTRITFAIPVVVAIAVGRWDRRSLVASSLTDILQLVNRSPRLTGRTDLWGAVLTAILKHPWLGYGFNGFWQGLHGESASVLLTIGWPALHSHNGFLDLALDLGLLGLVIFAIGYCTLVRRAFALIGKARGTAPIWLCTYLGFHVFLQSFGKLDLGGQQHLLGFVYLHCS